MKVSKLWLHEWVSTSLDGQQLAAILTMAGLEVDAVSPVASAFNRVIIAQIANISSDAQNDLLVCEIDIGAKKLIKVVCDAINSRVGLKVAYAQAGAKLPSGELSQGKLCSAVELGLSEDSEGILELEKDAPIGMDLRDYLSLNDQILDIDLTPNRADCFSVLGIARELAALTKLPLKEIPKAVIDLKIDEKLTIKLAATKECPRYSGRIIRNINSKAQTPVWMSERLRRAGLRPIHPVVDVTNYVMLELGQPMHAFDLASIEGDILIRFSKDNEILTLLDGQQATLNKKVLVIADNQKILAMAGIIGGKASAVQESTQAIFLESAFFNPLTIAGVARNFGLYTDSSQRFERGVDPNLALVALERATELLLAIVGGVAGPVSVVSDSNTLPPSTKVLFDPAKVKQLTGLVIAEEEMRAILQSLGMTINKEKTGRWQVNVPSHRFDIHLDIDLVEEIIRLYGYDKISGTKMITSVQRGLTNPLESTSSRIAHFLVARGYRETISYSFVDPELQQALYPKSPAMELINPISSELSQMRVGMWPGLLASMIYNIHRQQTAIKFFETGVVFTVQDNGTLIEQACVAGLLTGEYGAMNWSESTRKFDFYDLKGDLQALFALLKLEGVSFEAHPHTALHPGKSARIMHLEEEAGWCGVLHPQIADALELSDEVILFELRLNSLLKPVRPQYQAISKFPQNRRDLSFLVSNEISAAQIEATVRQIASNEQLKSFEVFDVYTGKSIPEGKKSLAITLTLQNDKRTMVDTEINVIIDAIIKKLGDKFAIILRE